MTNFAETPTERAAFVPVMVPNALVPEVLRFIADRYDTPVHGVTAEAEDRTYVWPIEKLAKFSASRVKTVVIVSEVLDYLAERPDQPVPTSELAMATGHTYSGLRAAWVKLSRHLEKHYGDPTWPLMSGRGPSVDLPLRETYYTIVGEQAERWKQVRQAQAPNHEPNS